MEWWQLGLDFLQALAWPVVVGGGLLTFRKQIGAKIGDLKETTTPVGTATFHDRQASQLEEDADRAALRQQVREEADTEVQTRSAEPHGPDRSPEATPSDQPGVDEPSDERGEGTAEPDVEPDGDQIEDRDDQRNDRRWRSLGERAGDEPPHDTAPADGGPGPADVSPRQADSAGRDYSETTADDAASYMNILRTAWVDLHESDYDVARVIAQSSPPSAVFLAYRDLEKTARAAWAVSEMQPPFSRIPMTRILQDLTEADSLSDFREVGRRLTALRNDVVHGKAEVTEAGAMDFVTACERFDEALTRVARSKVRHPSRASLVREWWLNGEFPTPPER